MIRLLYLLCSFQTSSPVYSPTQMKSKFLALMATAARFALSLVRTLLQLTGIIEFSERGVCTVSKGAIDRINPNPIIICSTCYCLDATFF